MLLFFQARHWLEGQFENERAGVHRVKLGAKQEPNADLSDRTAGTVQQISLPKFRQSPISLPTVLQQHKGRSRGRKGAASPWTQVRK